MALSLALSLAWWVFENHVAGRVRPCLCVAAIGIGKTTGCTARRVEFQKQTECFLETETKVLSTSIHSDKVTNDPYLRFDWSNEGFFARNVESTADAEKGIGSTRRKTATATVAAAAGHDGALFCGALLCFVSLCLAPSPSNTRHDAKPSQARPSQLRHRIATTSVPQHQRQRHTETFTTSYSCLW